MTMLAYHIKSVLELVPEVMPLVKQASVEKEYPTDNRSSVMASALAISHMIKIADRVPDYTEMEKVAKAVDAYGLVEQLREFEEIMIKRSFEVEVERQNTSEQTYLLKESSFKGGLTGFMDINRIVEEAKSLYKFASDHGYESSPEVIIYAGKAPLNKEAALKSLSVRHTLTKEAEYIKLAKALRDTDEVKQHVAEMLADRVTMLDKTAGLSLKGFNFYKEAFHTKEAAVSALTIKLVGQVIPYENIARVGKGSIASYIGKDVAAEFDRGPANFKQVAETLPLDLQKVLLSLTKNV